MWQQEPPTFTRYFEFPFQEFPQTATNYCSVVSMEHILVQESCWVTKLRSHWLMESKDRIRSHFIFTFSNRLSHVLDSSSFPLEKCKLVPQKLNIRFVILCWYARQFCHSIKSYIFCFTFCVLTQFIPEALKLLLASCPTPSSCYACSSRVALLIVFRFFSSTL